MNGIKGYISIREASYRWGVSERRVNQYCAEGRIPGASRFGRHGRSRKMRRNRPTRASRTAPRFRQDKHLTDDPPAWEASAKRRMTLCLRRELVPPISERRRRRLNALMKNTATPDPGISTAICTTSRGGGADAGRFAYLFTKKAEDTGRRLQGVSL